ncbi:MAG: methyl-accepting chemotaxis protein, partial [Planctomycetota bacterium]
SVSKPTGAGTPADALEIRTPEYEKLWQQHSRYLANYVRTYGYDDLCVIDAEQGYVLFTTYREPDMGQNVATGKLKDEGLGRVFRAVKEASWMAATDFAPYSPALGDQTAFLGQPIVNADYEQVAVLVMQFPTAEIMKIVERRSGMGETGQSYLVGRTDAGLRLRSNTREGGGIGDAFEATYLQRAFEGESGREVRTGANGRLLIVAYDPLELEGLSWCMVSQIELEEAIAKRLEEHGGTAAPDADAGEAAEPDTTAKAETDGADSAAAAPPGPRDYFQSYLEKYGYGDLLLIHPGGEVFYSVAHAPDYQTNILTGEFRESHLADLVRRINKVGTFQFADFQPYAPRGGKSTAFLAQPVLDAGGAVQLIVAVEVAGESIDAVVASSAGMGQSGETFLVRREADDRITLRSRARCISSDAGVGDDITAQAPAYVLSALDHEIADSASFAGPDGAVLASTAPLDVFGAPWAVVARVDEAEALAAVVDLSNQMLIIAGIAALAILAVALLVARSITRPIVRGVTFAETIGEGDLSQRLTVNSGDEIGTLAAALNGMADNLEEKVRLAQGIADGDLTRSVTLASDRDALGRALQEMNHNLNDLLLRVRDTAAQSSAGADQVSHASQSLSQNTTQQAAAVEEVSSSMLEIGRQSSTNAESAGHARRLADAARESADRGQERMQRMLASIRGINDTSRDIAKVMKTIDDIAFRTNLIALNASVEAARAGRHGRGFAVVANEVRDLAIQSGKAARETGELIQGSIQEIDSGVEVANETAETLTEIIQGIQQIGDIISEIAASSNEQAQGVSQANQALRQVEEVTQQNAANAEETASSAMQQSSLARYLEDDLLSRFQLRETEASAGEAPETAWGPASDDIRGGPDAWADDGGAEGGAPRALPFSAPSGDVAPHGGWGDFESATDRMSEAAGD